MMTATRALATQTAAPHPPLHQLQLRAAVSPRRRLEYSGVAQDEVAAGAADPLARPAALPLQLVVAREYSAFCQLDAFAELGSRDFTVRERAAWGAVVLPMLALRRLRRNVPVGPAPADQLP